MIAAPEIEISISSAQAVSGVRHNQEMGMSAPAKMRSSVVRARAVYTASQLLLAINATRL